MKRCVLEKPGLIRVDNNAPDPVAGPGDVVVRVRAALTCGTDLKAWRRGHPKMPCPTPFGHEFAGEIVELGSGVEGFGVGEAIMAANTGPCGRCFFCAGDQENLCESIMEEMVLGAYAEYLLVPQRVVRCNLFAKPDQLSFEHAALLEPLSSVCFGLSHARTADLREASSALIIGAGPIGLLWLVALRAAGVGRVVVCGRGSARLEAARRLGADRVVEAPPEADAAMADLVEGRGADLVVECTGRPEVWERALSLPRRGGTAILFGGCPPGTSVSLDSYRLHYDGVVVHSPFHFRPRDVRSARELLSRPDLDWSPLVSSSASLDELPAVFERLGEGRDVKCAIVPQDLPAAE